MTTLPGRVDASRLNSVFAWPWFLFVAAVYPLWFLYLHNIGQVYARSAAISSVVALALVTVAYWIGLRATRSRWVAALSVAVIVAAFYSYAPLREWIVSLGSATGLPLWVGSMVRSVTRHAVFSALMVFASACLIWKISSRRSGDHDRLMRAFNVAAAVLVAVLVTQIVSAVLREQAQTGSVRAATDFSGRDKSLLGYNPDIYYIILDGYARADVLRDRYKFDNQPFLAELERRGFAVNDRSNANYYWTFLSLASSLNYDYLQNIAAPILADPEVKGGRGGFGPLTRHIQDNRASHYLRARGYRFVHLQSSWAGTIGNPFADEQVECAGGLFNDEYFRALTEMSWLQALGEIASTDLAECHKRRLQSLGDQASRAGPKFVFAHFLPPHHPYLFDREGRVLKQATISNQFNFQARLWEDKAAYLEQLRYVNASMLEVIDRIIAGSERPPLIILQSDHGPNLVGGLSGKEVMQVRLANFAAYLLPGAGPGTIPKDSSPVNQFRYLFNHYFEAGLPILPNKSYYSNYLTPLNLSEVVPTPVTAYADVDPQQQSRTTN